MMGVPKGGPGWLRGKVGKYLELAICILELCFSRLPVCIASLVRQTHALLFSRSQFRSEFMNGLA